MHARNGAEQPKLHPSYHRCARREVVDRAIGDSLATVRRFTERAECIRNRTGGGKTNHSSTYAREKTRLDDVCWPADTEIVHIRG